MCLQTTYYLESGLLLKLGGTYSKIHSLVLAITFWGLIFVSFSFEAFTVSGSPQRIGSTWAKSYWPGAGANVMSIQPTDDGGYVAVGNDIQYRMWIFKVDSKGLVKWSSTLGQGGGGASSVTSTSDHGFVVAGTVGVMDGLRILLVKLDERGNISWEKTYGSPGSVEFASSIIQTSDGGYVVVGSRQLGPGIDVGAGAWVFKIDSSGSIVWQKAYLNGGGFYAVSESLDGNLVAVGTAPWGTLESMWVVLMDHNGNALWQNTYRTNRFYNSVAFAVSSTSDGGYIVAGPTDSATSILLLKLNANGSVSWDKTYSSAGLGNFQSVIQRHDGSIVAAGYIGDIILVTAVDPTYGNELWHQTFRVEGGSTAYSVAETKHGGLIVGGNIWSNVYRTLTGLVLKLNSEGICCNKIMYQIPIMIQSPNVTVTESNTISVISNATINISNLTSNPHVETIVTAECEVE